MDSVFAASPLIGHHYQVDDWNEATFLGAAVGILVTVSLAAVAAVVLVLVRNRVGKDEASIFFLLFVYISGAPEIPCHLLTLFGKSDGLSRKHQVL